MIKIEIVSHGDSVSDNTIKDKVTVMDLYHIIGALESLKSEFVSNLGDSSCFEVVEDEK